jgi:hypothetical protein
MGILCGDNDEIVGKLTDRRAVCFSPGATPLRVYP